MKYFKYFSYIIAIVVVFLMPWSFTRAGVLDFFYKTTDILSVMGNKLLYNNNPIILRGVAVGNPYSRQYVYNRDSSDYEIIKKEWSSNVVRLSVHPGVYKRYKKFMKNALKDEIEAARKQGMFVIVDWHVIGEPNGWEKTMHWGGVDTLYYSSDMSLAEEFWKYMAAEYRNDRGVMFEIWNEPQNKNRDLSWNDIRGYMERLYEIIRTQGANNVIIAPGVYWSYDLRNIRNNPLKGENIAYAWHNYPEDLNLTTWDNAIDGLYNQYPILVTEWGFGSDPNNWHYSKSTDFGDKIKDFIIEKGLHFTAWCWHGEWHPAMLRKNWHDLTEFGVFTKKFLSDFEEIGDVMEKINYFIDKGVDENTKSLGKGERLAVLYSFKEAFGRSPQSDLDYEDAIKIARGHWPTQRSLKAEEEARNNFWTIYRRGPNMNNQYDNAAITVMAYGLRQKAVNRNLNSEARALGFFKAIYGRMPSSTKDWNILQAITYSGATR